MVSPYSDLWFVVKVFLYAYRPGPGLTVLCIHGLRLRVSITMWSSRNFYENVRMHTGTVNNFINL
jgi:hypothetical protein